MRIAFVNDTYGTGSIGRLTKELAEIAMPLIVLKFQLAINKRCTLCYHELQVYKAIFRGSAQID